MKLQIQSGTPWEDIGGYCRAIRVGNIIEVSGTTAIDGDKIIGKDDIAEQARFIFVKIDNALKQLNSGLKDVIRTRMFVTDMKKSDEIVKIHGEFFKNIKPAASLIGIKELIHKDLLIEIEVSAICTDLVN